MKCVFLVSKIAFKCNLHRYITDAEAGVKTTHGFEYDAPPHAPYREDAAAGLGEHTATLSLLLALAGTANGAGGSRVRTNMGSGGGVWATDDAAVEGSSFRHLSTAISNTASSSSDLTTAAATSSTWEEGVHRAAAAANSAYDTTAAKRAARASSWLQLTPVSVLEAPPSFRGAFVATAGGGGGVQLLSTQPSAPSFASSSAASSSSASASLRARLTAAVAGGGGSGYGTTVLPSFVSSYTTTASSSLCMTSTAPGDRLQALDGLPHAGVLVSNTKNAASRGGTRDGAAAHALLGDGVTASSASLALGPPQGLATAGDRLDGSLFGALVRTRLPEGGVDDDELGARLTIPPWGEGGLFDSWGGDRAGGKWGRDDKSGREGLDDADADAAAPPAPRTPDPADNEEDADDPGAGPLWMAAIPAESYSSETTGNIGAGAGAGAGAEASVVTRPTLGWDEGLARRPACGAFMSRGETAFAKQYNRHLRPVVGLFGAKSPAVAAEEEVVHAARRALAGGRVGWDECGASSGTTAAATPPPLRLPSAGAGVIAATLGPLADAVGLYNFNPVGAP
jgi:hypothetical protein